MLWTGAPIERDQFLGGSADSGATRSPLLCLKSYCSLVELNAFPPSMILVTSQKQRYEEQSVTYRYREFPVPGIIY